MIDEQTLRTLIESGGVGGTIVIVVWLLRGVFMKWLENIGAARKMDAERLTAERASEKALSLALHGVETQLKLSRGISEQMRAINEQMLDKFDLLATRDHLKLVHSDVKTIPSEVWRLGDPRLETVKVSIEERIADLQASIEDRLPPDAVNARAAICQEFAQMNERLNDIEKAMKDLSPPKNKNTNPASIAGYLGKQTKETKET
jgi:hypothetical protein